MTSKPANKIFDGTTALSAKDTTTPLPRGVAAPAVEPAAERTDFPCSVAQERFWLLDRLDPGNASYNVAVRWRLEGRVSTDLLERAWLTIIDRHEILRTVFLEVDGTPQQRIMPQSHFRIAEIDLSTLPPEQQQTEGDRIGVIEARAPFDVGSGPLIRATLLRFSSTSSIILVTTHQIVSDGWSIGIMAREMGVIYDALRHGKPQPLEPLPIQYADYSLWQLEWLRVRGTAAETEYWNKQLTGVKPFKVIPDRPRSSMPTTNGVIVSRLLPRDLTNRAQALCAGRGATLFAAALGALCAMLARYARQDEVVLGTQVSDRDQVELESMIGQFVNSLILRNDLSGDPRFVEVIDRVRDTASQALEYRHIPIERLLGMVKGEHGKANTPPISVNFIFQKTFIQNTVYSDFTLIDMPSLPAGAIYDLNFFMVERSDGWRFSLQYNTDQFERETANRLLEFFQNVLESATAEPQRRVSQLRLCSPEESHRLLRQINGSRSASLETPTVVSLFEGRVAGAPRAIAVTCAGQQLTYEEIHSHVERIAGGLRSRGIGPGSRVAICLERSPELPSLVLALLKIGASCILLDPAGPIAFLRASVATAHTSAVAVHGATRAAWQDSGAIVVDIDEVLSDRSSTKQLAAHPGISGRTEAYVALPATRSDGQHRVTVSHGVLATTLADVAARTGLAAADILVAASPLGIDVALAEMLLPLICGARLVIATSKELESPRLLAQLLKRSNATAMHSVVDTWSALQQAWSPRAGFKMLLSRGVLSAAAAQQWLQQGAELWTLYGATDIGIWSAVNQVKTRLDAPLIGAPVGAMSFNVVDRKQHVTEVGTTGELLIGNEASGLRLSTGDYARLRSTGQIEWLGRSDRRFLHRGYLVDPADIEAIIRRQPLIADLLVAAGADAFEGILVACVVLADSPTAEAQTVVDAMRSELERTLPPAVVPTIVVADGSLPLERDGTLNWRKLRATDSAGSAAPLHGIEEGLAAIWTNLLGVQSVDPLANFFELGGHSLLAARMLARVDAVFGRRITLNALFRAPTIRALADLIEHRDLREFDFRQMVKLQPNGSRPPLIAINNTGTYYPLAKCLGPDQPVISLQLFDPAVKSETMPQTLEEVAAGYVQLIQRVQPNGPYNLMGWCVAGALSFEIARQLTEAHKEVTSLYLMDSWAPRYIQKQPLLRRIVSEYSLRFQLARAEWRSLRSRGKSFSTFLDNRNSVKALRGLWDRLTDAPAVIGEVESGELTHENYDQWLLRYLQAITLNYEPRPFPGKLTLFRSIDEPTGWLFDPLAGWGAYADTELVMISGDHFTMFQEKGAQQMAARIAQVLAAAKPVNVGQGGNAGQSNPSSSVRTLVSSDDGLMDESGHELPR